MYVLISRCAVGSGRPSQHMYLSHYIQAQGTPLSQSFCCHSKMSPFFIVIKNNSPWLFPQHQISISWQQCGLIPVDGVVRRVHPPCVCCPAKKKLKLSFLKKKKNSVSVKCHLPLTQVSLSLPAFSLAPISPAPLSLLLAELPLHTKGDMESSAHAVFKHLWHILQKKKKQTWVTFLSLLPCLLFELRLLSFGEFFWLEIKTLLIRHISLMSGCKRGSAGLIIMLVIGPWHSLPGVTV